MHTPRCHGAMPPVRLWHQYQGRLWTECRLEIHLIPKMNQYRNWNTHDLGQLWVRLDLSLINPGLTFIIPTCTSWTKSSHGHGSSFRSGLDTWMLVGWSTQNQQKNRAVSWSQVLTHCQMVLRWRPLLLPGRGSGGVWYLQIIHFNRIFHLGKHQAIGLSPSAGFHKRGVPHGNHQALITLMGCSIRKTIHKPWGYLWWLWRYTPADDIASRAPGRAFAEHCASPRFQRPISNRFNKKSVRNDSWRTREDVTVFNNGGHLHMSWSVFRDIGYWSLPYLASVCSHKARPSDSQVPLPTLRNVLPRPLEQPSGGWWRGESHTSAEVFQMERTTISVTRAVKNGDWNLKVGQMSAQATLARQDRKNRPGYTCPAATESSSCA